MQSSMKAKCSFQWRLATKQPSLPLEIKEKNVFPLIAIVAYCCWLKIVAGCCCLENNKMERKENKREKKQGKRRREERKKGKH